jgi:EmrB/QacA subfamily drug resistance transporter
MTAYFVFAVACLALLLSGTSNSAVSVAFPQIQESLNTSLVFAGWILSIYQLVSIASMVLIGKVSDVFGRKRTFLLCMAFFIVGSLFAAIAPNVLLVVLARSVQAVGGGGLIPSVMAMMADQFPNNRQKAIALGMSFFPIGQIIGPNLGSWLLSSFGWRSIFWMNVPMGVLVVIAIALIVPSKKGQRGHIDFIGAGVFTVSLFSLLICISQIGINNGSLVSWLLIGLLFTVSVVLMVVFLRHENYADDPIIDLVVLKGRFFMAANAYNFTFGIAVFGVSSFIPLFAVSVYNMSTFESGLILAARSVGMILASTTGSFFVMRWGYRKPMLIGSIIIAAAYALFGIEPSHIRIFGMQLSDWVVLGIIALLSGLGMGIASPAANNACIDLMPDRVGTISGVRGMFRQAGGAISIAVTAVLLENFTNIGQGFHVAFLGMAGMMFVTLPFIFGMPERAITHLDGNHDK